MSNEYNENLGTENTSYTDFDANNMAESETKNELAEVLDEESTTEEVKTTEVSADTLDDVNVSNHKKGEMFDINEAKEYLETLNYIEVRAFRKNVVNEKSQLEYYNSLAEGLDIQSLAKDIAIENFDEEYENVREVLDNYESIMQNLNDIIALIDEKLETFKDIPKTTTYMTGLLIEVYNKKKTALEEIIAHKPDADDNYKREQLIKKYENLINVYNTRDDYSYLLAKANIKHTINDIKKQFTRSKSGNKILSKSRKVYLKYFSKEQMAAIENYITEAFDNDKSASLVFMSHLAKILRFEQGTGLYVRVVIFMMNILDIIASDIEFDIENGEENILKFLQNVKKIYTMSR